MITALLIVLLVLALCGGTFVHPVLFVIAVLAIVWLAVDWRARRGPGAGPPVV